MARVLLSLLSVVLVAACASPEPGAGADERRPLVVTTVSPITNIVANVAGDRLRVVGVVPEGENSHTFDPPPSIVRTLSQADLVVVNGLNLETGVIELAEANVRGGTPVVRLAEEVLDPQDYVFDFSFPREAGDPNPHLWTAPVYVAAYAEAVTEHLARLSPSDASAFRENRDAFVRRVGDLERAVRAASDSIPADRRRLLTYHDSFPYFARLYGWEVIGAVQPSDFSEPSSREVARLIDQVREHDVPAIFGSEVFPSEVLETIAAETGARYVDDLRDDDLPGDPGDDDHTLLALLVFDYRTIVGALGGDTVVFDAVDTSNVVDDAAEYA